MPETKEMVVRDLLVSYTTYGSLSGGTPALFLHGWRSSKDVWKGVQSSLLDSGVSSIALDLPGFGQSESPKEAYDVDLYAGLVHEWMKKLNIESAFLIGHSFGGRIAIQCGARYPAVFKKIVLVDSAGIREKNAGRDAVKGVAGIMKPFFAPAFMQPLRRALYRLMGAEDYLKTPELKETFVNVIEEDLSPLLPKITAPVLILWGANDRDTSPEDGKKMASLIPASRFVLLPGAGHYSFLDVPQAFTSELIAFLKS